MFGSRKYTLSSTKSTVGLSAEEFAFIQFKEKIQHRLNKNEFTHEDHYLKKWLIARDWNVQKALDMFNKNYEFRKQRKLDNILKNYRLPEVLKLYRPGGLCGVDHQDCPVLYELHGYTDLKGLLYSAHSNDLEAALLIQCETVVEFWRQASQKSGRIIDGLTMVLDCENVGSQFLWRPGINLMTHLTQLLEDNYPEMCKKMIVVNAPPIFPVLYNICRPTLSDSMKKKIVLLRKPSQLLQYISAEELPAYLGGLRCDSDGNPRCTTWINQGGKIPTSYYLKDLCDTENMQTLIVAARSEVAVELEVHKVGVFLRWEFITGEYDIDFRLEYVCDNKVDILLPTQRVNSHMVPEDGSWQCTQAGTYILVFDNKFSWMRSKTVKYSANVLESAEEDMDVKNEVNNMRLKEKCDDH